jgi:hypothetical protein
MFWRGRCGVAQVVDDSKDGGLRVSLCRTLVGPRLCMGRTRRDLDECEEGERRGDRRVAVSHGLLDSAVKHNQEAAFWAIESFCFSRSLG